MKKILILVLLVAVSIVFSFNTAEYTSAKIMGLGGAYTAIANDEMALFYNPAGLAYIDPGMMGHINVEGTAALDNGITQIINILEHQNFVAAATTLNGKSGSEFFGAGISYFTQGMSLGAFTSMKLFHKYYIDHVHVDINKTSLICVGFASKMNPDFALGVTFKALNLEGINSDLTYTYLNSKGAFTGMTFWQDDYDKRLSLGTNVGAMYKMGDLGFGASVENLFTMEASKVDSSGSNVSVNNSEAPKPIIRLGLGYVTNQTLLAADIANITDAANMTYHFGVQQKLLDIPFFEWLGGITARAGYLTGKKDGIGISSATIGAQARFLIAYLNINFAEKIIGGNKTQELSVSGQFTF
ncbi:MAG: hypothetical protein A2Y40_07815 [Candidatus Margulisbacteria bacterium GWF2_35_9]|nr:MAG: hypothetical protein A2Y40_07815 [Candidatus Margulisbacteria bacterium GWF2_35_9]